MDQFSCIFFHMHLMDPDFFRTCRCLNLQESIVTDGKIKLGNLVVLRIVRIKIILSVKFTVLVDLAVGRQTQGQSVFYHLFIQYRKGPGKSCAYRTGMSIGSSPELSRAAAENLGFCRKFYMDFQSDDRLILFFHYPSSFANARGKSPLIFSSPIAAWRTFFSSKQFPINCSPTGSFWLSRVQGMLMAGSPARFTATV